MSRLYIAGPMTVMPDFNYPAFNQAEIALTLAGYGVLNPTTGEEPPSADDTRTWSWFLRRALKQVTDADGIALLPGWEDSRGAQLETQVAQALDMPILPVRVWLTRPADALLSAA